MAIKAGGSSIESFDLLPAVSRRQVLRTLAAMAAGGILSERQRVEGPENFEGCGNAYASEQREPAPCSGWWRRRESNPRPKSLSAGRVHAVSDSIEFAAGA